MKMIKPIFCSQFDNNKAGYIWQYYLTVSNSKCYVLTWKYKTIPIGFYQPHIVVYIYIYIYAGNYDCDKTVLYYVVPVVMLNNRSLCYKAIQYRQCYNMTNVHIVITEFPSYQKQFNLNETRCLFGGYRLLIVSMADFEDFFLSTVISQVSMYHMNIT